MLHHWAGTFHFQSEAAEAVNIALKMNAQNFLKYQELFIQ
jgi:hypothetical protein